MRALLDQDPVTRVKEVFHWDDLTQSFVVETLQDVEPVVEETKAQFAATDERARWKGDLHRVAQIPLSVWQDLEKKGITKDEKLLKRWLNDRDNLVFRTRPGRV